MKQNRSTIGAYYWSICSISQNRDNESLSNYLKHRSFLHLSVGALQTKQRRIQSIYWSPPFFSHPGFICHLSSFQTCACCALPMCATIFLLPPSSPSHLNTKTMRRINKYRARSRHLSSCRSQRARVNRISRSFGLTDRFSVGRLR